MNRSKHIAASKDPIFRLGMKIGRECKWQNVHSLYGVHAMDWADRFKRLTATYVLEFISLGLFYRFSGFQPGQPVTKIQMKIFLPELTVHATSNTEMNFHFRKRWDANRFDNQYGSTWWISVMNISGTSVSTSLLQFHMKMEYQNVATVLTNMLTTVANSNWRMIKPLVDPTVNSYVSHIFRLLIQPIFEAYSLEEYFNELLVKILNTSSNDDNFHFSHFCLIFGRLN